MLCVSFVRLHIVACHTATVYEICPFALLYFGVNCVWSFARGWRKRDCQRTGGVGCPAGSSTFMQGSGVVVTTPAGSRDFCISVSSSDIGSGCFSWRWRGGAICRWFFGVPKREMWILEDQSEEAKEDKVKSQAKLNGDVCYFFWVFINTTDSVSSLTWRSLEVEGPEGGEEEVCLECLKWSSIQPTNVLTFQRLESKWKKIGTQWLDFTEALNTRTSCVKQKIVCSGCFRASLPQNRCFPWSKRHNLCSSNNKAFTKDSIFRAFLDTKYMNKIHFELIWTIAFYWVLQGFFSPQLLRFHWGAGRENTWERSIPPKSMLALTSWKNDLRSGWRRMDGCDFFCFVFFLCFFFWLQCSRFVGQGEVIGDVEWNVGSTFPGGQNGRKAKLSTVTAITITLVEECAAFTIFFCFGGIFQNLGFAQRRRMVVIWNALFLQGDWTCLDLGHSTSVCEGHYSSWCLVDF